MATAPLTPNSLDTGPDAGELRYLVRGVGWAGYQALLEWFGDDAPRMMYLDGDIEFMSPLNRHERFTKFLGYMVETTAEELDIRFESFRSATFGNQGLGRSVEPDECYYFASVPQLLGGERIDLDREPPPDLCLEIEITNGLLPKLQVYAEIGVPEIWRFDGTQLTVFLLGPDGHYLSTQTSACLPWVPIATFERFLREVTVGQEFAWRRRFRAWVREVLIPLRDQDEAGAG